MKQQVRSEVGENRGHRCKECNRMFSSGKALGGHVIQPANKDCKKLMIKSKTEEDSGSGPHSCVLCAKRFPSHKSLYGHMRCHPDREWRGMEPPPLFSEEDSTDPESEDETLRPSLDFVWAVTGKRGRYGNASPDPDRSWSLELLNRLGPDSGGKQVFAPEPVDTVRLENRMLARRQEEEASRPRGNKKLKMSESETEFESEVDLFLGAVSVLSNGISSYVPNEEKLSHSKHICGTCNKGFQSPQALGGHMSTNNKLRINVVANNLRPDITSNGGGKTVKAQQSHVCPVCEKSFTTGQALGGHKKRHNTKKNIGDGSSKENEANVRDFDLNQKPDADAWS